MELFGIFKFIIKNTSRSVTPKPNKAYSREEYRYRAVVSRILANGDVLINNVYKKNGKIKKLPFTVLPKDLPVTLGTVVTYKLKDSIPYDWNLEPDTYVIDAEQILQVKATEIEVFTQHELLGIFIGISMPKQTLNQSEEEKAKYIVDQLLIEYGSRWFYYSSKGVYYYATIKS